MEELIEKHAMDIVSELAGSDAWNNWTNDGNVLIENFFFWLWDGVALDEVFETGIEDLIMQEFDMYLWH